MLLIIFSVLWESEAVPAVVAMILSLILWTFSCVLEIYATPPSLPYVTLLSAARIMPSSQTIPTVRVPVFRTCLSRFSFEFSI